MYLKSVLFYYLVLTVLKHKEVYYITKSHIKVSRFYLSPSFSYNNESLTNTITDIKQFLHENIMEFGMI